MTVKDYEDRYDTAHLLWVLEPSFANTARLDRARAALYRARQAAHSSPPDDEPDPIAA
jgi:hypothetical protein